MKEIQLPDFSVQSANSARHIFNKYESPIIFTGSLEKVIEFEVAFRQGVSYENDRIIFSVHDKFFSHGA